MIQNVYLPLSKTRTYVFVQLYKISVVLTLGFKLLKVTNTCMDLNLK